MRAGSAVFLLPFGMLLEEESQRSNKNRLNYAAIIHIRTLSRFALMGHNLSFVLQVSDFFYYVHFDKSSKEVKIAEQVICGGDCTYKMCSLPISTHLCNPRPYLHIFRILTLEMGLN